ncbi:MAG TPA: tetratricopeptide repeat protein [Dehalococcoidia bacterium]|nr:tetratricopeptide repeat protein [Dehalococcoidia bacterium]
MNPPVEGENSPPQDEAVLLKKQGTEQAIELALESKWEEAVNLNRQILGYHESDVDAWNRLGKALLELGRYREARDAYGKSLALDPVNSIAKRNLDRLAPLTEDEPRRETVASVAQDLFIEEIGKTGVTLLHDSSPELLATLTAGDEVYLKPGTSIINVEDVEGNVLGAVEPKMALRLLRLIEGGNKYAAAVKSVTDNAAEVIIKETYRDPSQTRLSFPAVADVGRAYTKESLLRLADDDDDEIDDDTESEDWTEGEPESTEQTVTFSSFQSKIERDTEEEDEE